jgi:hypothetical protein
MLVFLSPNFVLLYNLRFVRLMRKILKFICHEIFSNIFADNFVFDLFMLQNKITPNPHDRRTKRATFLQTKISA